MDLVLTSLTSKKISLISRLLLGGLVLLVSCSSIMPYEKKDSAKVDTDELKEIEDQSISSPMGPGPTYAGSATFIDKTSFYGLDALYAVSMNAVDFNFDGHTDLIILKNYYSRPLFYVFNVSKKKFELWKHDPLPSDFKASYLYFYDVNKDKIPDLIAGVLNQRSEIGQVPVKLYLGQMNKGSIKFVAAPGAISLPPEPTSAVTLIDYDLDGWLDLFISNWYENKNGMHFPVADRFLRSTKGKFAESTGLLRTEASKPSNALYPPNARPTYGASTCDIDQNGFPDILTVSSNGYSNKLWMNSLETVTSERHFRDMGQVTNYAADPNGSLIPTGGGRTFFSACTDYNDDGLMDVFLGMLSHAYDNDSVDRSSILTGSKETFPPYFLRTEYVSEAKQDSWNQGDRRGIWVDYNLDGRIDLLVDNSGFPPHSRLILYEQNKDHSFEDVAPLRGIDIVNPSATVVLDINKDGRPDILTSQSNIRQADIPPRLYLFENQTNIVGRRAIKVHLSGNRANTHGLGAMVMLYTKKGEKRKIQKRWVEYSQGGLASQNEEGVHFGVDVGTEALGVKVRWPLIKKGFSAGAVVEHLYPLKSFPIRPYLEITVCEDGKALAGNVSCAN